MTPTMSQDNNARDRGEDGGAMDMADPTRAQEAVRKAWGSGREATRKSAQDHAEDRVDAMFDGEGKVRKDAKPPESDVVTTFGRGLTITEADVERMRDRNKSPEELLREIRDELRTEASAAQGPGGSTEANGERGTVSKSETVLKTEDVEDILAEFRRDTGAWLGEDGGVQKFREWLAERVHGDGPGGGPKEPEVLEGISDSMAELEAKVRDRVQEAMENEA